MNRAQHEDPIHWSLRRNPLHQSIRETDPTAPSVLYPEAPADKRCFIEYLFQCRADHRYVTVVTVRSIMSTRSHIPDSCHLDRVSRYQIDANAHVHMHMGFPFHSSAIHHGYLLYYSVYTISSH